ncbi:uncharacterized protein LOC141643865 isoform X3 [Silene latifolia]|uniref:uncharacterized protein LOC141643865 isoform X3 n=1 Tax=Silene latifolia TaxID=37657 RepID=UPI003D772D75
MKLEVAASESEVIQKDDDFYPSDTIVEQAGNQRAQLKNPISSGRNSMDKEEEDISGDASEEVYISPETTAEKIKACLSETGIKLTAPFISSVDDTQNTHDDIRNDIPSAEKGDMDSTLPEEQRAEIMQTSLQECSSTNMGDNIANDSKVVEVEHENNEINAEVSQMSSMLLKPDIEKTAEYVSDEMDEQKFSEKILHPIEEKSVEQPFYEESCEAGDISAQLKAEDDSLMKMTEIQVENKHIALTADQEGKSPKDLNYEKERDNEGMSPKDAQQISEEIIESSNVSCADEEAEPTSEPQQSYQEILEPSQIIHEGANDSKENANDNSTEREVTKSTEEMLVDSSSTIEECSKPIESETYESKTIRSEDGAYVDQLAEHATIEATEKSSQVGLAAVTGPANIQENDEHQTSQTVVEENETVSEMIKQKQSFPESDLLHLQEKNVISTESISHDNANMTNTALEGDNDERVELKAEETGYSFEEQNVETATREPYSSDQISSADEISVPFSEKGDSAISTDSDNISSLNDHGNMESLDTEAKLDMMQEVENKREIVVETASNDITEEINEESYMLSENQVDNLTNKATDEPGLIVDSRQNIPLPAEDQINKLTDVREKAYESVGEKNAIEEENDSIRSPDKDPEKDSESNNEEIQNDSKPGQSCRNEPDIVKHLEIVNPEIEETKLEQGEQNQENSIHNDAIGPDEDAQSTFTNIGPTSLENHEVKIDEIMEETVSEIEQKNIENVELRSVRDVTSAEENIEDSTNSTAAENNVTYEDGINKGDDQSENQSLNVTCVQTGTEAEDTINKTDDSEKEVDLQYTEETQSTRDATVESFQSAITDEMEDDKNLENTKADPSQEHDEINNKNSNYDEESNEYKEQEPNEANEFHLEEESKTEEAKTQVYEEGSSSNKEGIRNVEVSQSQDECSKVYEDGINVIEVEETTDKQHQEQEESSAYGEHDGVLADQMKAMNAGMDSQNEIELNTSNSDGVHVQEDQTERESCKYDEMDESDSRKDKEIISQEFEQDKLVNAITSQESSPPIEPLEHNLGAAMEDPTVSQPSEIVDDESLSVEASQVVGLEAEQHIQTNEYPEQENDISADTQIIQGDSAEHITNSAIGYEDSTTFAEAGPGSADHLKIVDSKDDEHAENIQESESENQGLASKEVDTAIEANKDDNFDQLPKDLQHNNDAQNFENEGAQKDGQQVLLEAGSDVEEFQEMNANPMELSENTGAESDNIEVQNDGGDDEEGVRDDTAKTVPVTDPKIEGDLSTGIPSQSGKLDQEINADNPVTSRDEDTGESSEAMQIVDIREEVSADCHVSSTDPGTDIQQENENNTASLDCQQDQEDQRGHESFKNSKMDESQPEKDIELINQGFEQESISSEMPCQETSATIEALRQDIGTAIDDHTQNEPSEIANDKVHIVEVSKEADLETEQHNQTNEEPEHENEISAEESMDVENREFIPESAELREVNITKNETINSRTADLGSNTVEDLSGSENTNLEVSEKVINLDEDPKVNTEVMTQDKSVENRELVPESAELAEDNDTENEAISSRAMDLGRSTVEDLSGNEGTNSEISQKVTSLDEDPRVNTDAVPKDMSVENRELVPESAEQAEENNTENEIINRRAEDLGSNTIEDSGNENTNLEISQKEINTEDVHQDMDVEDQELIPESTKQREENNAENEAINSRAADLGSNTVEDLSGNENIYSEISQKVAKLDEDPRVNTEVMPQDVSVENRELIPESVELTEENNTENEAVNSRAEDLGLNTVEDRGNENTNLEISQTEMEISLNENPILNREVVLQVMNVESHEIIPELTELREENNTENEATKSRGEDLRSNTIEDLAGYENTNPEIPQNEINSDEDPTVNTEVVPRDIEVENHKLIPESTELREENNTNNEAINIRAEDDLSGNENTNSEMSQKVTNLNEDPKLSTEVMPQDMSVEDHGFISESTELREENNTENEAANSIAKALGSNTVEDLSGNKNTNSEISQKEINLDENPIVDTEVVLQDMSVENRALVPESAELKEENNTKNEAINSRAEDLGSNTVEDSGNENTNLEISQKEISLNENPTVNTDVVLQDMDVESHELIPESTELREENSTENEAIKCRAVGLGSNTVEDHSGNENTNSETSQKLTNLDEEKNTEVMPQVMDDENLEFIPESTDIRKENNTENEAINGRGEDLGSNTIEDLTGNENTNLEISQREIYSEEDPTVIKEIVPRDMDVENHELIPESTELREENNTENEAINSKAADLGSNTVEDLSGNENTNSEMSQKVTNLDEDPRVDTEVVPRDVDVGDHEIIPESTENTTENEAINSKADDLGSNTIEDSSGNENTNLEISQKEISLNEDPIVETEGVLQDMDVENHKFIPESTELIEENNTENEAIKSKAEESGPNTAGDLGGNENTNSEMSQINLDEDPIVKVKELQTMEKIQDDEEPENTEREITQEGSQHTLAEEHTIDQEKPIDTADTSQLENEEKTCMYDEEIQEVKETHEQCKFNEMNESVTFKNKEIESQGFEDDCTSKRKENEQTPMHSEASGQNVGAETPNQDNEECRIDAFEVINAQEVAEHDEHRNEALLDKINEQEVICPNASSSGNEMDTSAEQTTEPPLEISQTNNADQGPELGVYEQSIEGNEEEDKLDSNKPKFNMEMVVNPIEESQLKDDRENEINGQPTQTQSGNGISTAIEPSQYIQECEPNDAKQDGNVSNVTKSYIDGHSIDESTPDETVQTQGKQPVEPQENILEPSSPSEATSTTQGKEDCSVTLQDLNKEKEEDPIPEKATQRELQVSSGFELYGDLPYKPAVGDVSKTEEYLVPEAQGANDTLDNEKMEPRSCTSSCSHEINSDADQFQHNSQQTARISCADEPSIRSVSENYGHASEEVTENQEETKSPEQLIELNNEQTMEDIIDGSGRQAVKSEMTVEESKSGENYGPHGTSAYDSTEEVAAGSIEIVERSSEPVPFKESKRDEDETTEEKEETSADAESHEPEFYKIDNDADRYEKTLSSTECNTKSDECSITISKNSKEISEEPHILVTPTSLEGEAVGENFQQSTSEERTENEVTPMEPKMHASELLHQMNVPKPDNMDDEKGKQQESAKGLECCSTLESQQGNDRTLFTEMEVPENPSSRETDSSHFKAKLKVDEIQSEGIFPNESDVHMDCQEKEKISTAEIIASHICQEIETEEKLNQPSSEHQNQRPETSTLVTDANDDHHLKLEQPSFGEEVLHEESTENSFRSFDNPTKIVCAPEEREIEHPSLEVEPDRDLEQTQDLNEKLRTMDNSVRTDPNELPSEFQGVESSAEVESDKEDSTLERLNVKEVCHLNEKRETDESSQLNFKSQPIFGENLVNSCETSEEIGNDTQLQTVKNELMGEGSPSNFEVYEAVVTDAAREEEMHEVNTTVSSEDRALEQPSLPTTKSCDETKKPLIADEHSANTTFSVSQVSGINNPPPTETNATEEKVSEEQPMKKVSNHDSNTPQTMQIDKEEQLQENYDDLHQSSRLQELCGKDSVNMRIDEPVDTVDVLYNGMNVENFTKEGSVSSMNEVPSLEPVQSLTKSKEEIADEKYNETEEKPMLPSIIDEKKSGEWVVVSQTLQDDAKRAADEPKTEKEKEDTENDHGEEDSELIPMISEASRDIELKTQNKKSLHILSGMGSKMKNSISKVKKAMACASPQFSPDDVIIKLNKSKKS